MPRVYGRVRIAGQIIWATRFEEEVSKEKQGGKGGSSGTTVKRYSYYGNFAIGLSEGPIDRIGRVSANGRPFNMAAATYRIYTGSAGQDRDSLIEAKQSPGEAPAYRDTAYIVFERLPLEDFGNRIPLLSFEVVRAVGGPRRVPGGDHDPWRHRVWLLADPGEGDQETGNNESLIRHTDRARTDWEASVDELQAICPNLESVALVAAWFGSDLRADQCSLQPAVTTHDIDTTEPWLAGGLLRPLAPLVSQYDGKPAFGGTPSDASVIAAIRDLSDRGLKVMFHPFIMMDIPAGTA